MKQPQGAILAAEKILMKYNKVDDLARIINEETGLSGLLEAAKAFNERWEMIERGVAERVELYGLVIDLRKAIAKAEGKSCPSTM